jgi:xanthine dehydrogenase YagS FAD-binding subunit
MNTVEWADATSVEQAVGLLVRGAAIKAGGVDLIDLMKERIATPTRVVNIREIAELDYIKVDGDTLRIGPLVTLAKLAENVDVRGHATALAEAAAHSATPQIRNMATLGGNLLQRPRCWYFRSEAFPCRKKGGERCFAQDGENQYHAIFNNGLCAIVHPSSAACALVALNASIEISGAKDKRVAKLEEFFTLPNVDLKRENSLADGEIITEVRVPARRVNSRSTYLKLGEKESFDWPLAEVAAAIEVDGPRCVAASIVLGAAAPVPHRAPESEKALVGKNLNTETITAAAKASMQGATPLSGNSYKQTIFETQIRRALLALVRANDGGTR